MKSVKTDNTYLMVTNERKQWILIGKVLKLLYVLLVDNHDIQNK